MRTTAGSLVAGEAGTIDSQPEDPATLADPYATFARLRDEDPCH